MYHFELRPASLRQPGNQWEKEVEKIFDGFTKGHNFTPACEINETEKFYCIGLDVPGLRKEELDIEVKDDRLHISGERKNEERTDKNTVLRSERRYGKFSRVFTLPQHVNTEAIEARFENGVLDILIPKEEKTQTKKITISSWNKETTPDLKS